MTASDFLAFHDVTFAYPDSPEAVLLGCTFTLSPGWTGVVGPNGAGKTTLLQIAAGLLTPDSGRVRAPGTALYCSQRTDDPPEGIAAFMLDDSAEAWRWKGLLEVQVGWEDRWETLSEGERKRTQLAVALWSAPVLLIVDEPTNHLDRRARDIIASALAAFSGVGLLVSHDRELLDTLTARTLVMGAAGATLRPGAVTQAMDQEALELGSLTRARDVARKEERRLRRETTRRREEADRADAKRSRRQIAPGDHDSKARIGLARLTGKDAVAGRLYQRHARREAQARAATEAIVVPHDYETGIWLEGSRSPRASLLGLRAGKLELGDGRTLAWDGLHLAPDSRVGVSGDNGTGKSTLLAWLSSRFNVPADHLLVLPQELTAREGAALLSQARALSGGELGYVMSVVRHLGSDPGALLRSALPSPGETRKLFIALHLRRAPHLIVMDEPTNHLDLVSTLALERALAAYPGALLLVSHDRRFFDALTTSRWHLSEAPDGDVRLLVS